MAEKETKTRKKIQYFSEQMKQKTIEAGLNAHLKLSRFQINLMILINLRRQKKFKTVS